MLKVGAEGTSDSTCGGTSEGFKLGIRDAAEKASEMFLSVGSHLMRWLEPDLSHKRWVQEMDSTSQPLATIKPRNHCHYFIASRVNRPPSEHEKETSNCNSI